VHFLPYVTQDLNSLGNSVGATQALITNSN